MNALADLKRGWTLRGDQAPCNVQHVIRLLRRSEHLSVEGDVPPGLYRRLAEAQITATAPNWVGDRHAEAWLILDDEVCCPLVRLGGELRATTVLVRAQVLARRRRQRRRALAS